MAEMTKQERVRAAVAGQPVDRVPVSLWGHDFQREGSAEELAEVMLERHWKYEWDFMKVNPRASYHVEGWGARYRPSSRPQSSPELVDYPVRRAEDWQRLTPLDPEEGALGEQLAALKIIGEELAGNALFIETIFNPISVASRLAGGKVDSMKQYMQEKPEALHEALSVIAETFRRFAERCLDAGASGIFFATTDWAGKDLISAQEYRTFGTPYDLEVLKAVRGAPFNVLHLCGPRVHFDLLLEYPVHAINWAATLEGNPSLGEALGRTDRAVMGGVSEKTTLKSGHPQDVVAEVRRAIEETGGLRFFLAPGCTVPPEVTEENVLAARNAAWEASRSHDG